MTKAQHTPGPWNVGYEHDEAYVTDHTPINAAKWAGLAQVVTHIQGDAEKNPRGLANAQLIAAAPDLLEALEFVQSRMGGLSKPLQDIVNAAIFKATA